MDIKELDLNQLTMDDVDFSGAREGLEQEKRLQIEYQKKNMETSGGTNI